THQAPRRQSAVECLIEQGLRAGECVAVVVTDKDGVAREGERRADDGELDRRASGLRIGLLNLFHVRLPLGQNRRCSTQLKAPREPALCGAIIIQSSNTSE